MIRAFLFRMCYHESITYKGEYIYEDQRTEACLFQPYRLNTKDHDGDSAQY